MSRARAVAAIGKLGRMSHGAGFRALTLRDQIGSLDPVLSIDHFHMSMPTFPPHPHAGFSAVTYMFEDSSGGFINRDSLGDVSRIAPGDIHWTQAARGIIHEEVPERPGVECHGLQIFVNLPADRKLSEPRIFRGTANEIPVAMPGSDARIRVVSGEMFGIVSPLCTGETDLVLLDVSLRAGAQVEIPLAAGLNAFALIIRGTGQFGAAKDMAAGGEAVRFLDEDGAVTAQALAQDLQFILFAGRPFGEPVMFSGPFAMSNMAEIAQARLRYLSGDMGALEPFYGDL